MVLFREDKGAAGNGWRRGVTHTPTGHAEAFRDTELLCVPLCLLTSRLPSGDGSKLKQLLKHGTFASDQAEQSDHLTVMFNVWFLTAALFIGHAENRRNSRGPSENGTKAVEVLIRTH